LRSAFRVGLRLHGGVRCGHGGLELVADRLERRLRRGQKQGDPAAHRLQLRSQDPGGHLEGPLGAEVLQVEHRGAALGDHEERAVELLDELVEHGVGIRHARGRERQRVFERQLLEVRRLPPLDHEVSERYGESGGQRVCLQVAAGDVVVCFDVKE
jgi:hypothetical protein